MIAYGLTYPNAGSPLGAPESEFSALVGESLFAVSVRRLRDGYGGSAVQVVRNAGSPDTQAFGFDLGGDLDAAGIVAFCTAGAADGGTVATWYDQSGNGRHFSQGNAGQRPNTVVSDTLVTTGGIPALGFDQALSKNLRISDFAFDRGSLYIAAVATPAQINSLDVIVSQYNTTDNQRSWMLRFSDSATVDTLLSSTGVFDASGGLGLSSVESYTAAQHLIEMQFDGAALLAGKVRMWLDGTELTGSLFPSQSAPITEFFDSTSDIRIGCSMTGTNIQMPFNGTIQEVIAWAGDMSASRAMIAANINAYFGIF